MIIQERRKDSNDSIEILDFVGADFASGHKFYLHEVIVLLSPLFGYIDEVVIIKVQRSERDEIECGFHSL